jgi:hypothetical protein
MASKTVSVERLKKMAPSSREKREATRRQGQCQMCLAKVPLKEQYTVTNNLDKGTVLKRKDAAKQEDKSHYCGDCADKRVKMKERWIARRG